MSISFDGATKVITLSAGTVLLDSGDLYSRWKDWVVTGDNSKYSIALSTIGGEPVGGGVYITAYYFIQNGWKIKPQAASHTLTVTGNITTSDSSSPFVFPLGGYNIDVVRQFALKTETVNGGGDPFTSVLESGMTRDEALRIMFSALAGAATGLNSNTSTVFKSKDGTKDRITATVDVSGNRTGVVVDGS